jgi:hypothetical protein
MLAHQRGTRKGHSRHRWRREGSGTVSLVNFS